MIKLLVLSLAMCVVGVGAGTLITRAMDIEDCARVMKLAAENRPGAYQTEAEDAACERRGMTAPLPIRHFYIEETHAQRFIDRPSR